jgi:hypothetical protein
MPRVTVDETNKAAGTADLFPKIVLGDGERCRINAGLEQPVVEWVHELRAPKIENGQAVKVEKKRKKGGTYFDYEYEFVGRPLCTGDFATLADKGVDYEHCLACSESRQGKVSPPKRRFAVNVLRYSLRPGSWAPAQPFTVTVVAWTFTENIFNKLVEFKGQLVGPDGQPLLRPDGKPQTLRDHDLLLGPPEEPTYYQRYPIQLANEAWIYANADLTRLCAEVWNGQGNRATDEQLSALCGRQARPDWIKVDLDRVREKYAIAERGGSPAASDPMGAAMDNSGALTAGLDSLLGSQPAAVPQQPAAVPAGDPFAAAAAGGITFTKHSDDPFGGGMPPAPAQAEQPRPEIPGHPGGLDEFMPQPAAAAPVPTAPAAATPAASATPAPAAVPAAPAAPVADPFAGLGVTVTPETPQAAPAVQPPAVPAAPEPQPAGVGAAPAKDGVLNFEDLLQ